MQKFILTLKHDKGKIKISTFAENEKLAIEKICNSEGCPKSAIQKIEKRGFN
jgi:hypothetical protein